MLQDVNVDATLLVALQVLPAVSTFITGFVSVLVHAGLDRAREQADRLEERIEQLVDADSAAAAAQLQDLAIAHRHALQMRRSARFGDLVNTVILAFVAVLALVVYKQGRLELPRGVDLAVIPATSAALLAIVVIEAAVVVIGWLDHLHVQLELGRRAKATIWAKVAFIERSINARSDLAKARRLAHEVFLAVPAAIWPLRLRARTNLAMAARPGAAAAATVRAATTGLAEINLVITAKQSRQNRLADDLKLRAWGNVLLGNLLAAAADLQAAIGEDPSRPDLWLQLGEIQGHLGANQAAFDSYEQAARLAAFDHLPLLAQARLAMSMKDFGRASVKFDEALDLVPGDAKVRQEWRKATLEWAKLEHAQAHWEVALAALDSLVHDDPRDAEARELRDLVAEQLTAANLKAHATRPTQYSD